MRQERPPAGRRPRAGARQRQRGSGGVGSIISNVLRKRNGISRSAPRLLCTLEPGVDTRLKFTIEPSLGKNGFQQWYDALKAVARLPTGVPKEWRKRVWLTLADQYLHSISIDWEKTLRFAFNERSNPDDDSLGIQIVKDLHRTGCSSYCGQEGEQDRVVLKRVLLAFARWNKTVGYCQGFNVLAALILEVTEGSESDALKVMIYLIDKVLPDSYFANNLRALSVDMAVFRDLLRLKLPRLSQHLHHLQKAANREAGGSYEPPLTNVFTMQWFLTMFATCLPAHTVLRIWDSVFFEGSEVLFRVALAIWERLGERIEDCQTADEFYSTMGGLTQEMLEQNLIDATELMQEVYSMAAFPFPQLAELREKYTYNITPFPTSVKPNGSGRIGGWESDDDVDMDDEDSMVTVLGCLGPLGGLLAPELQRYQKHLKDHRTEQGSIAELSPGAVGAGTGGGGGAKAEHQSTVNSMMMERMSTDIYALKKQYSRIKRRQQAQTMHLYLGTDKCPATRILASQLNPSSSVVNHLLLGRKPRSAPRSCRLTSASLCTLPGSGPAPLPRSARSPWRAYVRQHRKNISRARAQLGFGDSEEHEEEEESPTPPPTSACIPPSTPPSPRPAHSFSPPLTSTPSPDSTPLLPSPSSANGLSPLSPPPTTLYKSCSPSTPSLYSASSSSRSNISSSASTPALNASALRHQNFSPFPSVKQPRKSQAARNLGLYGPTSRTPAVRFPQLSRGPARSSGGGAESSGWR
uniref:TBC1 domain family member 30 n=1 Tax=Oryzias latipes TaxID=8090 RepID=H2MQP7_ORYLA